MLKKVVVALAAVVVLGVGGGVSFLAFSKPKQRPLTDRKFAATPERLARGKYLMEGDLICFHCHSEHDMTVHGGPIRPGALGAGWNLSDDMAGFPGKVVSPNITPDPETGIGTWTDDEIARAIREGVGRDGHALFLMPSMTAFRNLSDEELASVVVYLRTIPPVKKQRAKTEIDIPVRWFIKFGPQPLTEPVPEVSAADPVKHGEHLVKIGACVVCHTPVDDHHQPLPGMEFAGGQPFPGNWGLTRSANITPDPSGLAHYDQALFFRTIRTGNIGGRRLNPLMPWLRLRHMSDADLKDMWAYLKSLKPIANDVQREPVPEMKDNPDVDEHPEAVAAEPGAPDGGSLGASP